jgi:hypothetical protein
VHSVRDISGVIAATFVLAGVVHAFAHEEQVIVVGRNSAGELQIDSDFAQPVKLPVSIFSQISGYATGELGIHSSVSDEPTNDFFQVSAAADFRFILLAKDSGMEVWNDTGSGYMEVGDVFFIGPAPFDTHPIWNLVSGTPGNACSLTLKLRDVNGIYPDSDPFVLSFATPDSFEIKIAQIDGLHAALSWTTNAFNWTLESAASPGKANWNTVTNAPELQGTRFSVAITTTNTQQFFRLRKQ